MFCTKILYNPNITWLKTSIYYSICILNLDRYLEEKERKERELRALHRPSSKASYLSNQGDTSSKETKKRIVKREERELPIWNNFMEWVINMLIKMELYTKSSITN